MWPILGMIHQCYYCEQIFNTREDLYQHLEVHATTKEKQEEEQQQQNKQRKDKTS